MHQMRIPWEQYELTAYQWGSGPETVVLVHGGGLDSAMLSWREIMEAAPEKYTAYALDLPGYGSSDHPPDMQGTMFYPRMVEALATAVRFWGLDAFTLCGLSMGGAIAIGYALQYPQKVKALLPLDSWGLVSRMPLHGLWFAYVRSHFTARAFRWFAGSRALVRWSLMSSLIGDPHRITDALVTEVYELCKVPGAERSMQDFQRSSLTRSDTVPDYTASISRLLMPTLYVCGQKDMLVRSKDCVKAAKATPKGRACILLRCKHWAQKDRPEAFLQALDYLVQLTKTDTGAHDHSEKSIVFER